MKCWDVVDLPQGLKAINSHIVYKLKLDLDNIPILYKVRIMSKGYQQRYGVDHVDSFSATVHPTAFRLMLALAAPNAAAGAGGRKARLQGVALAP